MGSPNKEIDGSGDLVLILRPRAEPLAWQVGDTGPEPQTLLEQDSRSTEQLAGDVDDEDLAGDDDEIEPKHKFLVSSHNLRQASQIFRRDLDPNGPWRQPEIQPDGLRQKNLDGFDPKALEHVLNLIHIRNGQVPDNLEMEELAEVAVIVDYFQCHEAVRFAVKSWIGEERIDEVIKDAKLGRPLILWLLIASVFGIDAIINAAAEIIIEEHEGPFESMGLPIAENITSRINNAREAAIHKLLAKIYRFKDDLSTSLPTSAGLACSAACEMLALGGLQKQLCSTGLYPRPQTPFHGFSVSDIRSMIKTYQDLMGRNARPCSGCVVRPRYQSLDKIGDEGLSKVWVAWMGT